MNAAFRLHLLFFGMIFLAEVPCATAAATGEAAPDWTLNTPAGESLRYYTDSEDRVSVILFWATWCPYCRKLLPHLQTVMEEFSDQPVHFYALNVWEDADPVAYMKEHGFTFRLLLAAEPVADAYGVKGTPGLLVIDKLHRIRYQRVSGEDDLDVEIAVRETITEALKEGQR